MSWSWVSNYNNGVDFAGRLSRPCRCRTRPGKSVVTDPDGNAVNPWAVKEDRGATHEIVPDDFDFDIE